MSLFLRDLLPRLFPTFIDEEHYSLRHHDGKEDLIGAIPPFIKGIASKFEVSVIIIHDQDNKDCVQLKAEIKQLCKHSTAPVFIPIPCRELEAWYLGDPEGFSSIYQEFDKVKKKNVFRRNPDDLIKPSKIIKDYVPSFSKTDAARNMGKIINTDKNKSKSFQYFIRELKKFVQKSIKIN
ncbi:DUF4276 family protein [Aquicella siphonis]|nr:DUF4276 family protein [Aquicella siphonis]